MGILDFFKPKKIKQANTWREFGKYNAMFTNFGSNIYDSDLVRACIRALAEFTSKANCRSSMPKVAKLLNERPNLYMTGPDFLEKVRTRYEIYNNVFIYIKRDNAGHPCEYYPVPYQSFRALEYMNGLFIEFSFANCSKVVLPWEDLAAIHKDYNSSDIAGDDNAAIIQTLELISITNQGVGNAVKATANLRGLLKSTKGMIDDEDVREAKDRFVKDYLNIQNEGGIAALDALHEFIPINMSPTMANAPQMKEFRENVYRYFGVNDDILMSRMTPEQVETFYEMKIEPFLVKLSSGLTAKSFTKRELGYENFIIYESNKLQFVSMNSKLQMIQLVDRAVMTPNELREVFNLAPYEGGDEFIRRLDTAPTNDSPDKPTEDKPEDEQEGDDPDA